MKFETTQTVGAAVHKILRSIPVEDQQYLALFSSYSGIWLEESRTLQSYLLRDEVFIIGSWLINN